MQRVLSTVTLLGLLVATAAAFAVTEHLKLAKSPLRGALVSKRLSPVCGCPTAKATVRIKLRRAGRVTVSIHGGGHQIATIARNVHVPSERPVVFSWDGRTAEGTVAPDGVYHPWVDLAGAPHPYHLQNRIVLDTHPPKVLSVSAGDGVLFVGPGRGIQIRYVFSEKASAVVYLGRQQIIRGRPTRPRDKVKWSGRLRGTPLHPGTYVLSVAGVDLAGNETPAADRRSVTVVLRYVEVAPPRVSIRAGAGFTMRVRTSSRRYLWRLAGRRGAGHGRLLRLRAPAKRGTYGLIVTAGGHTARAAVTVRGK